MAEISREEAIHQIGEWYGGFAKKPSEYAIYKAISDMEKLDKIEHELYLLNNAEFEIPNNAFTFIDRVEQILRGGE